jgi:hypothetical protein
MSEGERGKKVYECDDDGSDIFTQPHHTNRTIEIHRRTKNKVASETYQLEKNGMVFLLRFVLMQKYDDSC